MNTHYQATALQCFVCLCVRFEEDYDSRDLIPIIYTD